MKHPLSGLPAPTAGRAAARAAAALLAGCGPSHDAPANAGQASAKAQQNGPASVAVARGKIEVEGGLLDLSPAVAGVVQQLSVKEGQSVQRGQLLLRLADDTGQADLAVAESEAQLAKARQKARAARLPQLKQTLSRWQAAAREGAADAQNVDEAAQALRDAQAEIDVAAAEAQVAQRKLEQLRAQHKRQELRAPEDRKSTRLNSSHLVISYAVFCLKKKKNSYSHASSQRNIVDLADQTVNKSMAMIAHPIDCATLLFNYAQPYVLISEGADSVLLY